MAGTHSIRITFTEKRLEKEIRSFNTDSPLVCYDRGGNKSVSGLALIIHPGKAPTYQIIKKINGRMRRRKLGDWSSLSLEDARNDAGELIRSLARGEDPNKALQDENELDRLQRMSFHKALETFLEETNSLRPETERLYRQALKTTYKKYQNRPLSWFTPERVRKIHAKRTEISPSRADADTRVLRLVWNWARDTYKTADGTPVYGENPVTLALSGKKRAGKRGWNNVPRKESIIPRQKLPDWFRAIYAIREDEDITGARRTSTYFLEALCLTGLRFNELASLTWDQIDPAMGTLTVPDSTAKNRRPLIRPLTSRVRQILESLGPGGGKDLVFPGRHHGKSLNNCRKLQLEIQARTDLWITPHDLRRVYASAASRAGLPPVVTKRLLNHLSGAQDVTEGYQIFSLDELLDYSQEVEDQILQDAGLLESSVDNTLSSLLEKLPEEEKRRLIFQLSEQLAEGVDNGGA